MKIGMIGLGKLGYPVIKAIKAKGHDVAGWDHLVKIGGGKKYRGIDIMRLPELTKWADIVFIAVQTPHEPEFDGSVMLPKKREDFNYSYLLSALEDVIYVRPKKNTVVAVISTCLPGTFNEQIKHLLPKNISYVYNPAFIAMGSDASIAKDLYYPEFNLIGVHNSYAADKLKKFYKTMNDAPNLMTDITTAEAIKVSYNTFITFKTVLANLWGEIAHEIGANVDDITRAWSLSTKRLLSSRYLKAGVGDGGPCHPRDNIALSNFANEFNLSHNLFDSLMTARENHMAWLAHMTVQEFGVNSTKQIIVLGRSFKPESRLEAGSASALLVDILRREYGIDPVFANGATKPPVATYFIGTKNKEYAKYKFPRGSTVIDPFRYIPDRKGVNVIRIGEGIR